MELSKLLEYKFHYEYVKNGFDANLLFTDQNSLAYEIKSEDVHEECFKDRKLFDFSEYIRLIYFMIVQIKNSLVR